MDFHQEWSQPSPTPLPQAETTIKPTSLTPDGENHRCPVCGALAACHITPLGDTFCPACGSQFWVRLPLNRDAQAVVTSIRDRGGQIEVDRLTSQWNVDLRRTRADDNFVACLARLGAIGELLLNDLHITDEAVASLCELDDLEVLELEGTQVTDAGVQRLTEALNRLQLLSLADTPIGDPAMTAMKRLRPLWCLDLDRTSVTDAGLISLGACRRLEWLFLNGTQITDVGLKALEGLSSLTRLELRETRVTPAGVADLQTRLARCDIKSQ